MKKCPSLPFDYTGNLAPQVKYLGQVVQTETMAPSDAARKRAHIMSVKVFLARKVLISV